VRTVRICVLILAALALSAPLGAEEINAPRSRWNPPDEAAADTSTINWARVADDAQGLAQGVPQGVPQDAAKPTAPSQSDKAAPVAPPQDKNQRDKADEQIKEQEHQRVLGVVPSFNVSYREDAVSLTGKQKIQLAFRSSIDPVTFAGAFLIAGYHEVANDTNFEWGAKGYMERVGAAYLDTFDSNMIGNGILPALLHQDPRYFRLGHGSTTHRLFYAAASAFVCKHDNTGKREPNYSNVLGNVAAGAISSLYYPDSNSDAGLAISNGLIVTAEGAFGAIFQEFWPDVSRKLFHKDPTNGRDAQYGTSGTPPTAAPKPDKP